MDTKTAAQERFESALDGLIKLSNRIHAYPELGFEEEKSSGWLGESLVVPRPISTSASRTTVLKPCTSPRN